MSKAQTDCAYDFLAFETLFLAPFNLHSNHLYPNGDRLRLLTTILLVQPSKGTPHPLGRLG